MATPPVAPPPMLALVPVPPAPQNQVKNGFHTKTWGDGSKCVPPPPDSIICAALRPDLMYLREGCWLRSVDFAADRAC